MLIAQLEKQPGETLRRSIDYSCRFDDGQTIVGLATTVEIMNGATVSPLEVDAYIHSDAVQTEYFVAGGAHGEIYKITFTAEISDGQVMEDEVECIVEEH
jgi:hypothetical protein